MNTLLLGLALTVAAPAPKDTPKEPPTIVGKWDLESITLGGQLFPVSPGTVYTFTTDGKWLMQLDGQAKYDPTDREFTMDLKTKTPSVDLISIPKATNPVRLVGIFKIEKDTLTICGTRQRGGERPTKFESPEDSDITLYVMKRVKTKD